MNVLGRSSKGHYIHIHDELSKRSKRQGETLTSRFQSCPSLNCFIQGLLSAPFITTSSRREVELLRTLRFVPSLCQLWGEEMSTPVWLCLSNSAIG